jgi:hypothetical protein
MAQRPLTVVRKVLFDVFGSMIAASYMDTYTLCEMCDRMIATNKKLTDDPKAAKVARDRIKADTYKGSDDPGQWSPEASVVIHCESGIPCPLYDDMVSWEKVYEKLNEAGLFAEPVNGAVVAVYQA